MDVVKPHTYYTRVERPVGKWHKWIQERQSICPVLQAVKPPQTKTLMYTRGSTFNLTSSILGGFIVLSLDKSRVRKKRQFECTELLLKTWESARSNKSFVRRCLVPTGGTLTRTGRSASIPWIRFAGESMYVLHLSGRQVVSESRARAREPLHTILI